MAFIEEGRQLIQDFVTPEIRAIEARFDAVEKQIASLDSKVDILDSKLDKRVDQLEVKMDKRADALDAKIDRNQAQVMETPHRMANYVEVRERLARLEGKLQNVA
jgi:tetrahydromethanopterin S-methyltransferase subunit G